MYANIKIFRLTSDLHYQTNINSPVDRHIDMLCVIEAIQKSHLPQLKACYCYQNVQLPVLANLASASQPTRQV